MDNAKRLDVYLRQNGTESAFSLTPAQCRRISKKANRGILRRPADVATVVELPAPAESATVPACPTCKATGPCVTGSGNLAKAPHKARTLLVAA